MAVVATPVATTRSLMTLVLTLDATVGFVLTVSGYAMEGYAMAGNMFGKVYCGRLCYGRV